MSGGWTGSTDLTSTELLVETASAWVYSGNLPYARSALSGANIDNRIFMIGLRLGTYDILLIPMTSILIQINIKAVLTVPTTRMKSWSSTPSPGSGSWWTG